MKINLSTIIILLFILLFTIVAGFLSSYTITVLAFTSLIFLNLFRFLFNKEKLRFKFVFLIVSLISFVFVFHSGLLVRNNQRKICSKSTLKDKTDGEFNIRPISLDTLDKKILAASSLFEIDTLKSLDFSQKKFFIKRLSAIKKKEPATKILIIAGMHGSETAGVYAIPKILEKIESRKMSEEIEFEIIYGLNPVGLTLFNRYNECNCDINRDFLAFKTTQSQLLRDFVKEGEFNYVLDLHEGPYGGHYFINNTSLENLTSTIKDGLEKEGIKTSPMLHNKLRDFLFRYELDNPFARFNQIMTFDNYLNSLGIENILSESNGLSKDFNERIQGHVIVFDQLIESLHK